MACQSIESAQSPKNAREWVLPGTRISLSEGNEKLNKTSNEKTKVIGFGIPADYRAMLALQDVDTCPGASACKAFCYAKQGRYTMPAVAAAKLANLTSSLSASFVAEMVAGLAKKKSAPIIRIHDAGDFYSQSYFDKWCEIARAFPERIFYAYTKNLRLDLWSNKPENLRIVQSLGGKWDHELDLSKPHSRVFATHDARIAAGYEDGSESDWPAINGTVRIGLVYHGTRKLTLPQIKHLS